MRKTRIISLALVAMLFFSLTAFTPAKSAKADINLGTHISFKAKDSCAGHNYITTQYGKWELVKKYSFGMSSIVTYKYRREVTEVCTKCANVKTHYEYKYEKKWLDLISA